MAFSVETNIASLNTQRNLQGNANSLAVSLQRLSTGTRINSAKDDAAGLQQKADHATSWHSYPSSSEPDTQRRAQPASVDF